jgi:PadR family transcriptional regulator PadR
MELMKMAIQAAGELLDGCILSVLTKEDAYGYKLTQNLKEALEVSESTLYPIMRRLQKEECLTAYDEPHSGRNRRYYKITESGHQKLREIMSNWTDFKSKINIFLGGKTE